MVLRVRPTPTRFPTNSLYTPVDKHTLAFYIKCVPPDGGADAYTPADLVQILGQFFRERPGDAPGINDAHPRRLSLTRSLELDIQKLGSRFVIGPFFTPQANPRSAGFI